MNLWEAERLNARRKIKILENIYSVYLDSTASKWMCTQMSSTKH